MRGFLFALSFLTLTFNCFAQEPQQAKAIEVQAGHNFTITLKANATTGYQWQFAKPLEETVIQLISSEYLADNTGLVGSGGKQIWVFKALKSGRSSIPFRYVRPWEENMLPEKEEFFIIIIK